MPTAFVSGSGQGIGESIALRLADEGFDVAINDLPGRDLSSVVKAVMAKGRRAIAVPADVTSAEAVEAAIQQVVRELDGLDVMVANAGIAFRGPLLEASPEQFAKIMSVNVGGVFNCFQAAGRHMIKQGRGGRLIAASSIAGKQGAPGLALYSATKFAVRGLALSLAVEVGSFGITVNCYCPNFVDTPMTTDPSTGGRYDGIDAYLSTLPIPRIAQVEDVANVVAFLASQKSGYITGQSLSIDGGATCF